VTPPPREEIGEPEIRLRPPPPPVIDLTLEAWEEDEETAVAA